MLPAAAEQRTAGETHLPALAATHAQVITSRSSVLVLGDARTNYREPKLPALARIVSVAKHAYWLNPEHHTRWGLGDSEALAYAEIVPMHECANVDQLTHFVTRLLPV